MGPQPPCSVSKLTECRVSRSGVKAAGPEDNNYAQNQQPPSSSYFQVKALTREVGTLREDLRREVKKRERAVARTKECEEVFQEAESRAKALEYANK